MEHHNRTGESIFPETADAKRKIRLLDPSYMSDFVEEFKSLMNESVI